MILSLATASLIFGLAGAASAHDKCTNQDPDAKKVLICHNGKVIDVSINACPAHIVDVQHDGSDPTPPPGHPGDRIVVDEGLKKGDSC